MALRRKVVITVSALLVLAGFGYGIQSLVSHFTAVSAAATLAAKTARATCMRRGATVVMHVGPARECVGITDGSFQFVPGSTALNKVLAKIAVEDKWVRDQHASYATIAYLLPISGSAASDEPVGIAAEQLEGAYAAQYYANHVQDQAPYIQLLVASGGMQAAQWPAAVRDIENDVTSQHLVAVAGIGISLTSTYREVEQLAVKDKTPIPVVGSSITSDAFSNIKNMVRVVPDNAQEVRAILKYIWPVAHSAILVEDINGSDSYDTTLISGFTKGFTGAGHRLDGSAQTYNTAGETSANDAVARNNSNRIGLMPDTICSSGTSYVLFAGRGRDLATLLIDLGNRTCSYRRITVVTGDDVTDMPITAKIKTALAHNVRLEYAGEANPHEWDSGSGTVYTEGKRGFGWFKTTFTSQFLGVPYSDGDAMTGYDAMLTSIYATRLAGSQASPAAVALDLNSLSGPRYVPGATGPINLSADYRGRSAQGSNPVGKVIPVMRVDAKGQFLFKGLESADN